MKVFTSFSSIACLFLAATFFALTNSSCTKDPQPDPAALIGGHWELTFEGTYAGTKSCIINDDGSFFMAIVDDNNVVVKIEGEVDFPTGKATGSVTYLGQTNLNGITGQLNTNGTGSGSYAGLFGFISGEWIAIKK